MAITYPLTMPSQRFVTSGWEMFSVVGETESIYTLGQTIQAHTGQRWNINISLAPMLRPEAALWQAFFGKLIGKKGTFLVGDPTANSLLGAGGGAPVVDGASQTGQSINVRGLADVAAVWKAGDFIQLGSGSTARRHMVLNDVAGTGSPTGEANVDLWPRLRESPADGAAITTATTVGLFRLASNNIGWNIDRVKKYGFTFAAKEAI